LETQGATGLELCRLASITFELGCANVSNSIQFVVWPLQDREKNEQGKHTPKTVHTRSTEENTIKQGPLIPIPVSVGYVHIHFRLQARAGLDNLIL
jgi:hypothetical protein